MATMTTNALAAPKKSKRVLILIVLTTALAVAGAIYYLMHAQAQTKSSVTPPETPIFVALEPFTVNLQAEERDRFLHIGITLKVADARSQAQIVQYLPETRSRILNLLSNRDPNSLVTSDDKNKLASEVLKVMNKPLTKTEPPQRITNVLFTAFVVQ